MELTDRENAIRWWNGKTTDEKRSISNQTKLPIDDFTRLTGNEIEWIWSNQSSGKKGEQASKVKELILGTIKDDVSNFLYYDRKEDEHLSVEVLNESVKSGVVTVDEMVNAFRKGLESTYKTK